MKGIFVHWLELYSSYQQYDQTTDGKLLFEKIHTPVLVLVGEKDINAPLDTVIAAYKMLPNAMLAIIPDAPHPAFAVNFNAVWASIESFVCNEHNEFSHKQ